MGVLKRIPVGKGWELCCCNNPFYCSGDGVERLVMCIGYYQLKLYREVCKRGHFLKYFCVSHITRSVVGPPSLASFHRTLVRTRLSIFEVSFSFASECPGPDFSFLPFLPSAHLPPPPAQTVTKLTEGARKGGPPQTISRIFLVKWQQKKVWKISRKKRKKCCLFNALISPLFFGLTTPLKRLRRNLRKWLLLFLAEIMRRKREKSLF